MIRTQCYVMFMHTGVMIINGLFQALGRPISAGILSLSRQVICYIPCLIVLSLTLGEYGLAGAQAAADVLSMVIAVPLVISLFKKIKLVEEGKLDPEFKPVSAAATEN